MFRLRERESSQAFIRAFHVFFTKLKVLFVMLGWLNSPPETARTFMLFSYRISGHWLLRIVFSSALLAWMLLIYYLSSLPYTSIETIWSVPPEEVTWVSGSMGDRSIQGHLAIFAVLAWLARAAIQCWNAGNVYLLRWSILAVVFSVGYGVMDEFHQSTVPGRTASISDVGVDALGAVAAVAAAQVFLSWFGRRRLATRAA